MLELTAEAPAGPDTDEAAESHQTARDTLDRNALRASASGDSAAFALLYRRHDARLRRFLQHRFRNIRLELTDDAISRTMWAVWRQAGSFRDESRVSTWITGIAYRAMLKVLREERVHESADANDEDAEQAETLQPSDEELRDWVLKSMRLLTDDQRVTLELAYMTGLSCAEIAATMGCAEGTVKARLFHARARLRQLMPLLAGDAALSS